jgi:hypothetical protein
MNPASLEWPIDKNRIALLPGAIRNDDCYPNLNFDPDADTAPYTTAA